MGSKFLVRRFDQRPQPPRPPGIAILDIQRRAVILHRIPQLEAAVVYSNDLIVVLAHHHPPMLVGTAVAGTETDGILRIAQAPRLRHICRRPSAVGSVRRKRNRFFAVREMSLPKSAAEPASTMPPNSANLALILGSASPALISVLSLWMISIGVFFGATTPFHSLASSIVRRTAPTR